MGVYGCMRYAHQNGLVRSQATCLSKGVYIPIAVDLWNVLYGLMEKFYPKISNGEDNSVLTLRCLFSLLKLIKKRAYFPIMVFDGGINGEIRTAVGAKAIVAETSECTFASSPVGSGRLYSSFASCHENEILWGHYQDIGRYPNTHFIFDNNSPIKAYAGDGYSVITNPYGERKGSIIDHIGIENVGDIRHRRATSRIRYNRRKSYPYDHLNIDKFDVLPESKRVEKPKYWTAQRWTAKSHTPRIIHKLCVGMIRFLGYPYVESAESEADDLCANLYHTRTVSYVLSSDTDLILMGCDIIVDITHVFPSIIRCRDVLRSLNMDYPTFLTKFVRCHTDLHKEPTLKSMQEIADMLRENSFNKDRPCDESNTMKNVENVYLESRAKFNSMSSKHIDMTQPDDDGFMKVVPRSEKRKRKSIGIATTNVKYTDNICSDTTTVSHLTAEKYMVNNSIGTYPYFSKCFFYRGAWVTYLDSCTESSIEDDIDTTDTDPVKVARKALMRLSPAKTICEVMEHKYIKHVVAILTPEKRTSRVSILKRVPICQEFKDENGIRDLINKYVSNQKTAEVLHRVACRYQKVPLYSKILNKYWGS